MPWTVKDVPRFTKKAKTPEQKQKWVKIANGILRTCGGGSECEAKAIRIANSKFEEPQMNMMKIPQNALVLGEHVEAVQVLGEGENKKFTMVAYSGKVIKNHFWWGDLIIDLNGMKFPKNKYPILQDHMTDRKIGFVSKPKDVQNELRFDDITYVDTAESEEFQKLSRQGFPYEASIRAQPTKITRLREGEKAEVNGMTFKGPGTIWDESIFRESSVTVFGYDPQTKSQAFSEEEIEIEVMCSESESSGTENPKDIGGKKTMKIDELTLDALKEKRPDLFDQVKEVGAAEIRLTVGKKEKDLEKENGELKASVTTLSETVTAQGSKIDALEKAEEQRKAISLAKSLKKEADTIFDTQLSNSDIPEFLHEKVARMVSHDRFVKDGKLDVEAFTAAVDSEISDWESKLKDEGHEETGFGVTTKKSAGETHKETAEEEAAWESSMAAAAGVPLVN